LVVTGLVNAFIAASKQKGAAQAVRRVGHVVHNGLPGAYRAWPDVVIWLIY